MKLVQLARGRSDDPQPHAPGERLHSNAQERRMRDGVMPRIDGAGGPRKRTENQGDCADRIDALRAAEVRGAYQQRDAGKAEDEADKNTRAGPDAAGAEPIKDHHPERDRSNKERGNARGDASFGPGERAVAAEQQEKRGDDCGAPLRERRLFFAYLAEEWIENQTDGDMPDSRENKRRNRFDADSNEEIGRAPENVDGGERNQYMSARNGGIAQVRWGDLGDRLSGGGGHLSSSPVPDSGKRN